LLGRRDERTEPVAATVEVVSVAERLIWELLESAAGRRSGEGELSINENVIHGVLTRISGGRSRHRAQSVSTGVMQ